MISVFGSKVGEEEIKEVSDSINSQWMGMGPKVKKFENMYKQRTGLKNFIMIDNCSNGLYLAIELLNLPKNSEIIVPSFTWVSCAQAVLIAGHKPVFADVDIDTMNITKQTAKDKITENTAAIMVVHYAGLPVNMDEIIALGLPIIEDAAHAVDSYYKGKICGSIADVGVYSFDSVKNLAVGEGGGITSQSSELIERATKLRYCGIGQSGFEASRGDKKRWWEYTITEAHIKMNPSDISGAIGIAQLGKLDDLQAYRKSIWDRYQEAFKDVDWLKLPVEANKNDKHSYFTYAIRVTNGKRDELAHYLFEKDIYTTLRYHPLHLNELYEQMDKSLPNSEQLNEEALCIPLHPSMSQDDIIKVIKEVKNFK